MCRADSAKWPARFWVLAIAALSLARCAPPFQPPPPPLAVPHHAQLASPPPLRLCPVDAPPKEVASKSGYVQLSAYVTDESGKPIAGLKQSDFAIAGEDQAPMPIVFFRENPRGTPTSLAIIIDSSGSMAEKLGVNDPSKLQMVWNGLADVMTRLNECDEVATLQFGGHMLSGDNITGFSGFGGGSAAVRLMEPLTTDHALALIRLAYVVPSGQTPLYDSIYDGLLTLSSAHYPDRALILITDGMDTSSTRAKVEVLVEALRSEVSIYAIGLGDPNAPEVGFSIGPIRGADVERVDAQTLKDFTNPTGGRTFIVTPVEKDTGTFLDALADVADILGHSYSIGVVTPPGAAAGVRPQISLPGHPGARVDCHPAMPVAPTANTPDGRQPRQ